MIHSDVLHFLMDLKENNNRNWFQENKDRYEFAKNEVAQYTDLLIQTISDFDPSVKGLTAKDCTYRIFRDVRFGKDKSPYKTNMGAYIVNGGRKSPLSGYYLHIEPGASMAAAGIYCPESKTLRAIREDIQANTSEFKQIIEAPTFKNTFGQIQGEKLKTAPRGFDKNDPNIELLRFKSYTLVRSLDEEELQAPNFLEQLNGIFREAMPFNQFLNETIVQLNQ